MRLKKAWKIRNTSDPEYFKLGETSDTRRSRADSIENEVINTRRWLVTTVIACVALLVAILNK